MTRRFNVILERAPEDAVWVPYVPKPDYLSTYGDTREEALDQTREAVAGYLEAAAMEGLPLPGDDGRTELTTVEVAV